MTLEQLDKNLRSARPAFKAVSPGWMTPLAGEVLQAAKAFQFTRKWTKASLRVLRGEEISLVAGEAIGDKVVSKVMTKPREAVLSAHAKVQDRTRKDRRRKNGLGGRSWITKEGHYDMVIIYHEANKAGPHIDVHMGRLSLIYRVKPDLYDKLRYNSSGRLTEASRDLLIAHVRNEFAQGARVPQNLDHSRKNARMEWFGGGTDGTDYGAGPTRQIISESKVHVYKTGKDHPIEFYSPVIAPGHPAYIHRLYPGDNKRAPILIAGVKKAQPPVLVDRLHLKMLDPEDIERIHSKADMETSTAKYDGSSCYIHISPKGTTIWSPRQGKRSGTQIPYTHKLGNLAKVTSSETFVGMGELMFTDSNGQYLPQAVGSGILNSHDIVPPDVTPEIRLYRIDRKGRTKIDKLPFWENREIQHEVAALDPKHLKVVELMTPEQARDRGFEGFVAVPPGLSVNDGYKSKWWADAEDWTITQVDLKPGERGGIAGVVWCEYNGKNYKLGPGQLGNRDLNLAMMADPELYEGTVLKVRSRHGHSGRAAKVLAVELHDDKGFAPL